MCCKVGFQFMCCRDVSETFSCGVSPGKQLMPGRTQLHTVLQAVSAMSL